MPVKKKNLHRYSISKDQNVADVHLFLLVQWSASPPSSSCLPGALTAPSVWRVSGWKTLTHTPLIALYFQTGILHLKTPLLLLPQWGEWCLGEWEQPGLLCEEPGAVGLASHLTRCTKTKWKRTYTHTKKTQWPCEHLMKLSIRL